MDIITSSDLVVQEYLKSEPDLISIVLEAVEAAKKIFGDNATPVLDLHTFQDYGDQKLFLFLKTSLPAPEAGRLLDRFDEEYWIDKIIAVQGKMAVALEFQE